MTNLDQISLLTLCYSKKVQYQFFPFVSRKGPSEYVMTILYQQKPIITEKTFCYCIPAISYSMARCQGCLGHLKIALVLIPKVNSHFRNRNILCQFNLLILSFLENWTMNFNNIFFTNLFNPIDSSRFRFVKCNQAITKQTTDVTFKSTIIGPGSTHPHELKQQSWEITEQSKYIIPFNFKFVFLQLYFPFIN